MKKIILVFITLISLSSKAQECGTPQNETNQVFYNSEIADAQYCVNIKFHIVRETNGTGGYNATQLENIVNLINQFYNVHLINVTNIGFDYIDNSALYNIDDTPTNSSEFNQLVTINNNANAINFYIVNSAYYAGKAQSTNSRNLVVRADRALTSTSPHELGHCFNLYHTFHGSLYEPQGCAENTNGSNCVSCGDFVCDTPADSNAGAINGFNPDLTNAMSYYATRNHFTLQQGARMRNAINGSPILQATLSLQCATIMGAKNICGVSNHQYTFSNPQNTNILWSVTSNLEIINSSNTGITIKPVNSTPNGQATITANINGMFVTKVIWIGKPSITIYQPPTNTCSTMLYIKTTNPDITLEDQGVDLNSITWTRDGSLTRCCNNLYDFAGSYLPITLSATNSCGTTSIIDYVPLQLPAKCGVFAVDSLNPISNDNSIFKIFPNPANDIVNIDLRNQNNQSIKETNVDGELYDLMGNPKLKIRISNNKATFSAEGLNRGVYILKILINGQTESHKILVE